jgi:hypothetical protein
MESKKSFVKKIDKTKVTQEEKKKALILEKVAKEQK